MHFHLLILLLGTALLDWMFSIHLLLLLLIVLTDRYTFSHTSGHIKLINQLKCRKRNSTPSLVILSYISSSSWLSLVFVMLYVVFRQRACVKEISILYRKWEKVHNIQNTSRSTLPDDHHLHTKLVLVFFNASFSMLMTQIVPLPTINRVC